MSAETETQRFLGNESDLQEPTELTPQLIAAIELMIVCIRAPEPPGDEALASFATWLAVDDPDITRDKLRERMDDIRIHLGQAREEYADAVSKRREVELGYEKINQVSFKLPRNMRLYVKYAGPGGQPVTFACAPRDTAIHKLPYQLRNLIQRCAIS